MGRCANCSVEYTDTRIYCGRCGAAVASPCKRCGAIVPVEDRFCGRCGAGEATVVVDSRAEVSAVDTPAGPGNAVDLLAEVERDRERFSHLAPRLGQEDIAQIFSARQAEKSDE